MQPSGIRRCFLVLSILASASIALVGCSNPAGSEEGSPSGTPSDSRTVSLTVAELSRGDAAPSRIDTSETSLPSPSGSNGAIAAVDGFRITIRSIEVGDSNVDFTDEGGRVLEIGNSYNGSIEAEFELPSSDVSDYAIEIDNGYELKALAYTDSHTVYTTPSGIVRESGRLTRSELTEYGYYEYEFLYVTTAEGANDTSDTARESPQLAEPIEIAGDAETLDIQLLIDTYSLVSAWDGEDSRPDLDPFSWVNNNDVPMSDFFPDGQPNFGTSYIPMYLSIGDPGTTVGEVYVDNLDQSSVTTYDPGDGTVLNLQYMVTVWQSTGAYVGSRVVGFGDSGGLEQFNTEVTRQEDGSYWFYNGKWANGDAVQDRKITGFKRSSLGTPAYGAEYTNGPDAYDGTNAIIDPDFGRRNREELASPTTIYFKRVE